MTTVSFSADGSHRRACQGKLILPVFHFAILLNNDLSVLSDSKFVLERMELAHVVLEYSRGEDLLDFFALTRTIAAGSEPSLSLVLLDLPVAAGSEFLDRVDRLFPEKKTRPLILVSGKSLKCGLHPAVSGSIRGKMGSPAWQRYLPDFLPSSRSPALRNFAG
jgi:hypothetical protein